VCPRCGARYKVVRAEARGSADREIGCLACDGPLVAREGEFVLKYFLVDAPEHRHKRSA
jgi:hypothetical protein